MSKGLYIHYPFCSSKCLYCDFYSVPDTRRREEYEKALERALLSYKDRQLTVDTVFFGGGTPTLMTEAGRERIMSAVRSAFIVDKNAEITFEANPTTLSEPCVLEHLYSLGVNRLSLGAQSFHERELSALGRRHTGQDIVNTVKKAVETGFENISLDLMYRIPHQTKVSLLENISAALSLPITHLSLYGLSVEEHSVFGAMVRQKKSLDLVSEDCEREMYFEACELLLKNGFSHYEISNFARCGFESRHNLKYWHAEEYVGVGAAAHSYLDGVRFFSPRSISSFVENPLLREGEEIIDKGERGLERIMLGLRLSEGIVIENPTPAFEKLEHELLSHSLLKKTSRRISLTEKGFFVSNTVIEKILESLDI